MAMSAFEYEPVARPATRWRTTVAWALVLVFASATGAWLPSMHIGHGPGIRATSEGPASPLPPSAHALGCTLELDDDADEGRTSPCTSPDGVRTRASSTAPAVRADDDGRSCIRSWMARAIPSRGPPAG